MKEKQIKVEKTDRFAIIPGRLSEIIIRYPKRIILSFAAVTVIFALGATLLMIETNQEKYFPEKSPVRKASDLINSKFGGSQTVSVMIEGDIKDPAIMKGIDKLTLGLEGIMDVGGVFSISQAVREISKAIYTSDEGYYDRIPDTGEGIAQMFELYNMSGNPDPLLWLPGSRFDKFLSGRSNNPDVRGTSMLVVDNRNQADEMWIYLPALKKTRRIVSSEKGKSFMSSEFTNADMSSPPLSDFENRHLANSGSGNQWIIESVPRDEDIDDHI